MTGKPEPTDYFLLADILRLDFAKRFEAGELSSLGPNVGTGGALPKPRCSKNADPSEFVFAPIVLQNRIRIFISELKCTESLSSWWQNLR
jgi:hypothetical protein